MNKIDFIPCENNKYVYINGIIKFLETKLLSSEYLQKILDFNFSQIISTFKEIDYGISFDNNEENLDQELIKTYNLFISIIPDKEILDFFRIKYDFHNLKVFLKNKTLEKLFINIGSLKENDFIEMLENHKYFKFPQNIQKDISNAIETFNNNNDNNLLAKTLDTIYFSYLTKIADKYKISLLQKLTQIYIDIYNIMSIIRIKFRESDVEKIEKNFIENGSIQKDFFTKAYLLLSLDQFQQEISKTSYGFMKNGITYLINHNSYFLLEKEIDDFIIDFAKKAKYFNFGPELIIGYFLAKEQEVKNLRIIIYGKKNEIPLEKIKEKLRKTYI
ncbi:MAG: V-type ATPase subunit [bacterium]